MTTKTLTEAMKRVATWPAEAQEELAGIVFRLAGDDEAPVALTPDEREAIATSKSAAARGEFATDDAVRAVWAKHGL